MKAIHIFPAIILVCVAALSSCSSDSPNTDGIKKGKENTSTSISNSNDKWVYYSLEQNKQVGVSSFGDSIADGKWASRTDWDIAICGDLIRTNSGASGIGLGGIQESKEDYSTLKQAPASGYDTDIYE